MKEEAYTIAFRVINKCALLLAQAKEDERRAFEAGRRSIITGQDFETYLKLKDEQNKANRAN